MSEYLNMYKEFFLREVDRKHELNNSISIQILLISALISINAFALNSILQQTILIICISLSVVNFITITLSIIYLAKSFSNFSKLYTYQEPPVMNEVYEYEQALILEQKDPENAKIIFENFLSKSFAECSAQYFRINKLRTEAMAISKKFIFYSGVLTFLVVSLSLSHKTYLMSKENKSKSKPVDKPSKPVSTVQQPQAVMVQNSDPNLRQVVTKIKGDSTKTLK